MATFPSERPSDNVSCHGALTYLRALFVDACVCTCTDHTHTHTHMPTPTRDSRGLPPLRRCFSSSAVLPTYVTSWKRSRWPHELLFEENPVGTRSRPSTIQLHPREIQRICWSLLEWYLVSLWMLVKIHLHVYGRPQLESNFCCVGLLHPRQTLDSVLAHLSKIRCGLTVDLRGWAGLK